MASKKGNKKAEFPPTIQLKLPSAESAGAIRSSPFSASNQQVIFAIPAPKSVGDGLLYMCRQIFYTQGALLNCAYVPVTKEEATKLLRGPNSINVLQDPKLLTVSATGAVIGVQQTIGHIKSQPPVLVTRKIQVTNNGGTTPPSSDTGSASSVVAAAAVASVPSHSPALPQASTTGKKTKPLSLPSKGNTVTTKTKGIVSKGGNARLPKTSAVYSLAELPANPNSSILNKYAFAVAHPMKAQGSNSSRVQSGRTITKAILSTVQVNETEAKKKSQDEQIKSSSKDCPKEANGGSTDPLPLNLTTKPPSVDQEADHKNNSMPQGAGSKNIFDMFSDFPLDLSKKTPVHEKQPAEPEEMPRTTTVPPLGNCIDEAVDLSVKKKANAKGDNKRAARKRKLANPNGVSKRKTPAVTDIESTLKPADLTTAKMVTNNSNKYTKQARVSKGTTSNKKRVSGMSTSAKKGKEAKRNPKPAIDAKKAAGMNYRITSKTSKATVFIATVQTMQKAQGVKRKGNDAAKGASKKKRKLTSSKAHNKRTPDKPLKVQFAWEKKSKDTKIVSNVDIKAQSAEHDDAPRDACTPKKRPRDAGTQVEECNFGSQSSTVDQETSAGVSQSPVEEKSMCFPQESSDELEKMINSRVPVLRLKKMSRKELEDLGGKISCNLILGELYEVKHDKYKEKQVGAVKKNSSTINEAKTIGKEVKKTTRLESNGTMTTSSGKQTAKKPKKKKKLKKVKAKKVLTKTVKKSTMALNVSKKGKKTKNKNKKGKKATTPKAIKKGKNTSKMKAKTTKGLKCKNGVKGAAEKNKKKSTVSKKSKKQRPDVAKPKENVKEGLTKSGKSTKSIKISASAVKPVLSKKSDVKSEKSGKEKNLTDKNMPKVPEKTQDVDDNAKTLNNAENGKDEHAEVLPVMSIQAFTQHPDLGHIPNSDRVAYLKEMLRAQRASLGIKV